ncbi:flagellar type III secretion system pore protein FliP [Cryptosporangium phraense]|uniref:Flagellar biosynthetic protein FliP n=1 Tax=Cryptosporangium phraense TaxID=2593070 RepID=A0A545ADZ4_9ACTN|nr:flagellar type III secretion system pore protein FliP [Cryptosporangium phraense]
MRRRAGMVLLSLIAALVVLGGPFPLFDSPASASSVSSVSNRTAGGPEAAPAAPTPPVPPGGQVTVNVNNGPNGKPSTAVTLLIALTVLSIAPSLLLLCTSFTKVFVVLSVVRNALGLQTVPPNQVIAGLALFLSLFIMAPVFTQVNQQGVQPYLKGTKTQTQAFNDGVEPLRTFMLKHTRKDEIALLTKVADKPRPKTKDDVSLPVLIPAFILSELRAAFIIGFVIFLPFIVVDMVVSASLMSLGMMMLPPVMVSLPFKLLLFVMSNGWGLVVTALVASYR